MALPTLTQQTNNGLKEVLGKADVYIGNYASAGADMPFAYHLGSIDDTLVISGGPEYEQVMGGVEFPYAIESVLTKDSRVLKFTLRDVDVNALAILRGGLATISATNVISAATNAGLSSDAVPAPLDPHMIAEGGLYGSSSPGLACTPYYQMIIEAPNAGSVACPRFRGYRQYWKCLIRAAGDEAFKRTAVTTVDVEVIAHADRTVTPAIAAGPPVTAIGYFGKIVYERD